MISIELPTSDDPVIKELEEKHASEITVVHLKKFHGSADVTQVLIVLTPVIIPLLAKIIIEQIRSRKYVQVKHNGTVIQGISEKNVTKILEQVLTEQEAISDAKEKHNKASPF